MSPRSSAGRAEHAARTTPEWIVFGVSALILVAIVGALVAIAFQGSGPARPAVDPPGAVTLVGDRFYVPVDVVNHGDAGAAQVQVQAELTTGDTTTSADQVVDFLGRGETRRLTFVFDTDPADGELVVRVVSFAEP
jgi:uncharacterized protein (TIGR02588 family)